MAKTEQQMNECPCFIEPIDRPTKAVNLRLRFGLTLISWLVLGQGINAGNGFFVSLFLFATPLFADYLRFSPKEGWRLFLRRIGIFFSGSWVLTGLVGLLGPLQVHITQPNNIPYIKVAQNYIVMRGYAFPAQYIWFSIGITVAITLIEWVAYESSLEKSYISEMKNAPGKNKKGRGGKK